MPQELGTNEKPLSILQLDDDEADLLLVRRLLAKSGIEHLLTAVSSPQQARHLIESKSFDCVLLDYNLPEGNTLELFSDLFEKHCAQRPPIVMLTGMESPSAVANCLKAGAQEYLAKSELSSAALRLAIHSARKQAADCAIRREMDAQLVRLSMYDSLTGLPNRALFHDRIKQQVREATRTKSTFVVLMMDLNLFKGVNDTYGHEVGDELLVQVGHRLTECLRESDTVARLGGDEFAALLPATDCTDSTLIVAEKIHESIGNPFALAQHRVQIGISIGASIFPTHGASAEQLLRFADIAMYEAKSGKLGIQVYDARRASEASEQALILSGLLNAISNQELILHYQPQVSLQSGEVVGYEALVRWQHPQLGLLEPRKFLPLAERSEVIEDLTREVIRQALRQFKTLCGPQSECTISVNISAQVLHRRGLPEFISEELTANSVPAARLCLEITETGIMQSPNTAMLTLGKLSRLGVQISIDDFGSGYSSLKYLSLLPTDELKIDREFVSALEDAERDTAVVKTILSIGRSFGVEVVAEGLEDRNGLQRLRALGCKRAQGYLIAEPMLPLQLAKWKKDWPRKWRELEDQDAEITRPKAGKTSH